MQIQMQGLQLVTTPPTFGYEFKLEISFPGRQGARLYWLEKVSQTGLGPPESKCPEPSKAATWQNVYALDGGLEGGCPTFAGWRATKNNRGGVRMDLPDRALIQLKPSVQRTLEYWVVVVDGDTLHWGLWKATEFLKTTDKGLPVLPPVSFFRAEGPQYGDDGALPFPEGFDPSQALVTGAATAAEEEGDAGRDSTGDEAAEEEDPDSGKKSRKGSKK